MKQDQILIVGASGTVGSEIVRILKADGYKVRMTTSKEVSQSESAKVHVNLATGQGIKEAFVGIDRAFLLSPPGYADHYAILAPLIQQAKRSGLKKVVLMTAMGANASETTGFRKAEVELEKSGLNYNIIRPNWFMQNFNTFWIKGILEQSKIALPAENAKTSFIDARDISAVAAKLLGDDTNNNKDFDLSGPEAIDHNQVAQAISEASGKSVTYQDIAPEVLQKGLVGAGLPTDYVDFLIMIFGFLRLGYNASVNDNVKKIIGREPYKFQKYAQDFKANWL